MTPPYHGKLPLNSLEFSRAQTGAESAELPAFGKNPNMYENQYLCLDLPKAKMVGGKRNPNYVIPLDVGLPSFGNK